MGENILGLVVIVVAFAVTKEREGALPRQLSRLLHGAALRLNDGISQYTEGDTKAGHAREGKKAREQARFFGNGDLMMCTMML